MSDDTSHLPIRKTRPSDKPRAGGSTQVGLETACAIARAIQPSLGELCEIVVHDFQDLESSVIAYEGNLTGRRIGAPVTPLSLEILADRDGSGMIRDRLLHTEDGAVIKSTVVAIRNENGKIVGSFCLNVDLSKITHTIHVLENLVGSERDANPYTFPDDLPELIASVMEQETRRLGRSLVGLDTRSRQSVIASLEQHRVFAIRNSAKLVAEHLGISRTTLYADLERVRSQAY